MLRLVLVRFGLALLSLLVVSAIIFWAVEALPGDAAQRILGRDATPEALARVRAELRLDEPAPVRYAHWLAGALTGDFGTSLTAKRPVLDAVWSRAANTLLLAGLALALYVPVSLILGIVTAAGRGRAVDGVLSVAVLLGMCVPDFVVGIVLVTVFAVELGWFPPLALIDQATALPDVLRTLFLPALTLTIAMTAYAVRLMRENLVEVLDSPYVQMARLRGIGRLRVLLVHAVPNALGPAINVTALNIAWLIGSIVVVESVFNFPGMGRLLIDSISYKDMPVVQAVALLLCAVYILANLVADLAIILLNPKLRVSR